MIPASLQQSLAASAAAPAVSAAVSPQALPLAPPIEACDDSIASVPCPRCGGSGILRMGDQQYRTCLDCLGMGQLAPAPEGNLLSRGFSLRGSSSSGAR